MARPLDQKTLENMSATYVYFANVSNLNIQENMGILPKNRREKSNILVSEKDKKLSIGVYLLLAKVLKLHRIKIDDFDYKTTEDGKPFLDGCPLQFSLSHSGNYVAVALSKNSVGIDIQEMKDFDPKVLKLIANKNDQKYYNESDDKKLAFYRIWTSKESYSKFTGLGMKESFKKIEIDYIFDTRFFSYNGLKNYEISICTTDKCVNVCKEMKI